MNGTDDLSRRAWGPVCLFFKTLEPGDPERRAAGFFLWLQERGLPARIDLALGSLRQFLKGLLGLYAESALALPHAAVLGAAEAFDDAWWRGVRERAVERTRALYLSERRIVPFLVYQRSGDPATVAAQMGLAEEDVRAYLEEARTRVRAEARVELDADGEIGEKTV